jgi:hypothetical protein
MNFSLSPFFTERAQIVGWAKRSVPTIEVRNGGHGAKSAFAHPTPIVASNRHCERSEAIHGLCKGRLDLLRRCARRNDGNSVDA